MDKIIEYINSQTNNKYQNLLFFGATINSSTSAIQIQFSGLSSKQKTKENLEEIEVLCKQYLDGFFSSLTISFHSNSLTMQEFKDYVENKIISSDELKNIDTSKIDFDFLDSRVLVTISYPEGSLNESVLDVEKSNIEREISHELNQSVEIKFEKIKTENSLIQSRRDRIIEDNYIFEEMKKNQVVNLSDIEVIFGDFKCSSACLAGNLTDEGSSDICVVGNVSFCAIKDRKAKATQDINENDAEHNLNDASEQKSDKSSKKYMVIELEFDDLKTRCVWFLPKNMEETEGFSIGETLAISGRLNEFNGSKNITVVSVARCKFKAPEKVWRKCPSNYQYVRPEPYEFTEQTNFFAVEEKTKNKYLLENTFVVYDLETTGINPENCKIIDIGAFKIVEGKIVEKFCTFVNPECEIPEEASKVNRITNALVKDSPTIEMALPDFYKFCYGSVLVGYNNIGFDDLFVNKEGKRLLYNFDNKRDDAFNIAKKNIGGLRNYKLSTVCQEMSVPLVDAHRASNDALATAKLFIKLVEKFC